jgi:hypothetical protein
MRLDLDDVGDVWGSRRQFQRIVMIVYPEKPIGM